MLGPGEGRKEMVLDVVEEVLWGEVDEDGSCEGL